MTVTSLVRALDPQALIDIASGLARAESLWRPHATADAEARHSTRLLATDDYEVWVLTWSPGQSVSLHDHGPSAGALVVVDGTLTEVTVAEDGLERSVLREGSATPLPVGIVHDVLNEGTRDAVSIHVYSPPLSVMGVWDVETMTRVGLEVVDSPEPVHTAVA